MKKKSVVALLYSILAVICLGIWSLLAWEYYNGGVPSHYLLGKKDLPEISNWWGAIVLPLCSGLLLLQIKKQIPFVYGFVNRDELRPLLISFIIALLYGLSLSLFFSTGNSQISSILFKLLFFVALFYPIYKPQYCLGFIIGLTYIFGGVLPAFISLILAMISCLIYNYIRLIIVKILFRKA